MRNAIILLVSLVCVACGPKPQPQDPCKQLDCGSNGTCTVKNEQATCSCKKDGNVATSWYGEKCDLRPADYGFMAKEVCKDGGSLTLQGLDGEAADLNGRKLTVQPGAVDQCAIFILGRAQAQKQDNFGEDGKVFVELGVSIFALDKANPFKADGSRNLVQVKAGSVTYTVPGKRTSFVYYNSAKDEFVPLPTTITKAGSVVSLDRLRSVYNGDSLPKLNAKVVPSDKGEFLLDVHGTTDEGSKSLSLLKFQASTGGTPVTLKEIEDGRFKIVLPPGDHDIQVVVTDSYGNTDTKTVTVSYDLCKNTKCNAWETCNPSTGKCEGDNPCTPDYCGDHGSCKVEGDQPKCSCTDNWTGDRCEVAPTPKPEIIFAEIDCSRHKGYCITANTYDLKIKFKNATRFEIEIQKVKGAADMTLGSFSASSGDLSGNSHTIKYTLGGPSPGEVRIIIKVFGPGGVSKPSFIKVTYY